MAMPESPGSRTFTSVICYVTLVQEISNVTVVLNGPAGISFASAVPGSLVYRASVDFTPRATESDSGMYSCEVFVAGGFDRGSATGILGVAGRSL